MTGSVDLTTCLEKNPQSVVLDSVADPDNVLVPNTMVVGLKTLDFTFQNDKDLVGKTVDVVLKVNGRQLYGLSCHHHPDGER